MKQTRWIVLGLLVATGAAGCGTESPTGPSFARSTPPVETTVSQVPISEEPGAIENATWPDEQGYDVVDARSGKKAKKPKKPNHPSNN